MSFKELTDEIVAQHHSFLRRELPNLSTLISKLCNESESVAGNEASLAECQKLYSKIRNKIETHLYDEETVLFPTGAALEAAEAPPVTELDLHARLEEMEKEHENCGKGLHLLMQMLGALADSELRNRTIQNVQMVINDLDIHVEKENSKVHPRLLELLGGCSVQ